MKTVLITGVTGFIGRYVARQFTETGWSVIGLGNRPPENAPRQDLFRYEKLNLPSADLAKIVQELQPEVCIHCAGRASVELSISDPSADFSNSVAVTFNLLDTLRLYVPKCRLIYLSSAAVYGNPETLPIQENQSLKPISPYGFHKLMSEQLCAEFFQVYNLPTAIVRIFSGYGPGLRRQVLWDMCQKALINPALKLRGTGNESRDFIHGRDVARALQILAEKANFEAEVYNLANGVETTIKELAALVLAKLGEDILVEFDNSTPVGTPINWQADMSKLSQIGFIPEVTIERGINVYVQWCRAEILGW
ncbi:NAD-dependent epimerase/dehydratase family protein [Trichocoleus sp. ST-U3]|uniref:NAD-dependent epimerase/dehydratase family protein n=1 Tax=Coleofasciculus sp. FACHB-542 TaxID=2692787 RepID=UPI0016828FD0|nr:NAD-dependent epimerase/dehydratase family protein [Coleofasciculus sp. FACHB-542]MBD2087800.1 NAD-dependent epimerase/dehydratase family protein [Coleofasciculus sp. FACHB-542]